MDNAVNFEFPVIESMPPPPVVAMDDFFRLVEEARSLIRDPEALRRDILAEDIPVRFDLSDEAKEGAGS